MRMLPVCLVAGLLCFGWGSVRAEDGGGVSGADRGAIETVITSQLEAFRQDEGAAAFGFASPKIQGLFGDAPHFMAMVKRAYPPVYRPRSFTFGTVESVEDRVVQRVTLVGPDGAPAEALYTMEREPDGTWRIDGCVLTRPEGITA
ncbi:MAG: DUF4864 domain-containing protein [Acetobacteraceae bacterium]|nr:DUF4864 domain-containing protein [Acetobacteraceae bacterium]